MVRNGEFILRFIGIFLLVFSFFRFFFLFFAHVEHLSIFRLAKLRQDLRNLDRSPFCEMVFSENIAVSWHKLTVYATKELYA